MERSGQCFLVINQEVIFEVGIKDSVLCIIPAFLFLIFCYTKRLNSVCFFLENILLRKKSELPISVSNFISAESIFLNFRNCLKYILGNN